jgi:hypothetical protein
MRRPSSSVLPEPIESPRLRFSWQPEPPIVAPPRIPGYPSILYRKRSEEFRHSIGSTRGRTKTAAAAPLADPGVPPSLAPIIASAPTSPIARALQRKPLSSYPLPIYGAVLDELNSLIAACSTQNRATECCFLESVVLDVRNERAARLATRGMTEEIVDQILADKTEQLYCGMRKSSFFLTPGGRTRRARSTVGGRRRCGASRRSSAATPVPAIGRRALPRSAGSTRSSRRRGARGTRSWSGFGG